MFICIYNKRRRSRVEQKLNNVLKWRKTAWIKVIFSEFYKNFIKGFFKINER